MNLTVTLPACANFFFQHRFNQGVANGHLYRNATISYELPEAYNKSKWSGDVGRRMIVHFRPNGPARFIIPHGGPSGIAWFDTP